ncbi:MAG: mevalonate kinase [Sandaracinaceae bacterium]
MIVVVSAPGKLMIAGEYAVLDGAEAIVTAVDARLVARGSDPSADGSDTGSSGSPDPAELPPEALLAREHAEKHLGATPMTLRLDKTALVRDGRKLGLGSSSAASAAVAGAVLAWHGQDPAAHRERIFEWALAGHRAVAPEGSGADVAAATLGGVVRYHRDRPSEARRIAWPSALHLEVVWTGTPARTSDFVAKVSALRDRDPAGYRAAMDELRGAARGLADAIEQGDASAAVRDAGRHGRAMGELGRAAGATIVTESLQRVADLAEACGGASKPSGAGGGDVALAFFDDASAAARFRGRCRDGEVTLLPLHIGAEGVREESDTAMMEGASQDRGEE